MDKILDSFHVCTIASHETEALNKLIHSCQKHEISRESQTVYCLITGSEPCVIHANGRWFGLYNRIYDLLLRDA